MDSANVMLKKISYVQLAFCCFFIIFMITFINIVLENMKGVICKKHAKKLSLVYPYHY